MAGPHHQDRDDDEAPSAKRTLKMSAAEIRQALEAARAAAGDPVVSGAPPSAETEKDTLRPTSSVAAIDAEWPVDEPDG